MSKYKMPGGAGDAHKMAAMRAHRNPMSGSSVPTSKHGGKVSSTKRKEVSNGIRYGDLMRNRLKAEDL